MFKTLFRRFKHTIYICLASDHVSALDVQNGLHVEEVAAISLDAQNGTIIAVGNSASASMSDDSHVGRIVRPFAHPRTIIDHFTEAECFIRYLVYELLEPKLIKSNPVMILHPIEKLEGGLTEIEVRALREMALGAGAVDVYIWTGPELSAEQINAKDWPALGQWHGDEPA